VSMGYRELNCTEKQVEVTIEEKMAKDEIIQRLEGRNKNMDIKKVIEVEKEINRIHKMIDQQDNAGQLIHLAGECLTLSVFKDNLAKKLSNEEIQYAIENGNIETLSYLAKYHPHDLHDILISHYKNLIESDSETLS